MNETNWSLLGVFSLLSILAIGGGTAVLPEMKTLTIEAHHWLTDDQFRNIYSLGQLAPGPNMLMVIVIGYHVAGFTGALIAFVGFFGPAGFIALATNRLWGRFEGSPWRLSVQRAMAPIVVGLMASGTIAVARTATTEVITVIFAAVVFAVMFLRKINPALLILAGAGAGVLLLR
ncbi:chromate transporter [Pseudoxanthobacter soli DSM 19599]|mgnify:CR=1 FL=1|uniref:Chromate transporter n=1 Tax=Pseudoxanthobacter soli DSM 19599 TaxID=1123029 RepID=A0A1M7ZQE3_9HYPH|nr:chromate transporter [Pseudoxanthobacter soli]SHO67081.1 chromate transporter [Pseudoxanthobacter soli DSM 19599]